MSNINCGQLLSAPFSQNSQICFPSISKKTPIEDLSPLLSIPYIYKGNAATFSNYSDPLTGKATLTTHIKEKLLMISQRCTALPDLDTRSVDEILGYDKNGLPK